MRVSGLDFSVLETELKELFESIGGVIKVWIDYDRTDRSRVRLLSVALHLSSCISRSLIPRPSVLVISLLSVSFLAAHHLSASF